jgi:hypothetical protein
VDTEVLYDVEGLRRFAIIVSAIQLVLDQFLEYCISQTLESAVR